MSGKRKQSRSTQQSINKRRNRQSYAAAILTLTALVGIAFFSPGWVFGFQDSRQCSDMTLEERENVDVAVLSTNYESSFYQRMINFAENQTENTEYYVASEELTDYRQLREFLESENGLYRDSILSLLEAGLITNHIFECEISAWKQYVIYSDDYTKGVNFILWYIELEHPDMGTYKLLLEANTGEFYGMQADTGRTLAEYARFDKKAVGMKYSLTDYLSIASEQVLDDIWYVLAPFYSGLSISDFYRFREQYVQLMEEMSGTVSMRASNYSTGELVEESYPEENGEKLREMLGTDSLWIDFVQNYPTILIEEDGNRLQCTFPYGEGSLSFRMQMTESVNYPWTLQNLTVGFPAIYSLIPEFE